MVEAVDTAGSRLEEAARAADLFDAVRGVRDPAACTAFVEQLDTFLVAVARGRSALEIAIGERLDALSMGDRSLCVGYAGIGDYAREKLGIAASTAQKMARLARGLRDAPLLREAVRSGEVSTRQAEAVLSVARGDAEAFWVARARRETVRALKAAVKEERPAEDEDEPYVRLCIDVRSEHRAVVDEALEVAGQALDATAPKWQRIEALCQEYLSDHAGEEIPVAAVDEDWLEDAKKWLEQENRQWSSLKQLEPVPVAEPLADEHARARQLHAEVQHLVHMRKRWDEVFGHLAMLFIRMRGWSFLDFASLDHYAEERLGMCGRAVQQRAWLERRLGDLPSVRRALGERRISYEQARLIARYAEACAADEWIDRAAGMTCIELREALQRNEEVKMCARGEFTASVPLRLRSLLRQAFDAVRNAEGRWLDPGECLFRIAQHFLEVWKPLLAARSTLQKKILTRDRTRCQVPGCSRAGKHVHHIRFRSAGGDDDPTNLVSLCPAHHLRGIHMGRIRVSGEAPHGLTWELGVEPGLPPLAVFRPRL